MEKQKQVKWINLTFALFLYKDVRIISLDDIIDVDKNINQRSFVKRTNLQLKISFGSTRKSYKVCNVNICKVRKCVLLTEIDTCAHRFNRYIYFVVTYRIFISKNSNNRFFCRDICKIYLEISLQYCRTYSSFIKFFM